MTTDNNIAVYPILIPNNAMFKHFQKKVSLLMCLQMSRAIIQVAGVGIASTELYISGYKAKKSELLMSDTSL